MITLAPFPTDSVHSNIDARFPQAMERAARVRLMVFDVDGVLTDGRLLVGPEGEISKALEGREVTKTVEGRKVT